MATKKETTPIVKKTKNPECKEAFKLLINEICSLKDRCDEIEDFVDEVDEYVDRIDEDLLMVEEDIEDVKKSMNNNFKKTAECVNHHADKFKNIKVLDIISLGMAILSLIVSILVLCS